MPHEIRLASFLFHRGDYPARLSPEQVAETLGFRPHDIGTLVAAKKLKPLGQPAPTGVKWFSHAEVEGLAVNVDWLGKATAFVSAKWRKKNEKEGRQE